MYIVLKQLKKYDKALLMYEKYNTINDSILNEEYSNSILKLNIKEEYEYQFKSDSLKKDFNEKIYDLKKISDKRISSLKYIIFGLIFLLAAMILYFIIRQKKEPIKGS